MMRRQTLRMPGILLGCILIPALGAAVEVTFRVTVPGNTPAGESVFVVGNLPGLGEWNPGALKMTTVESGVWDITIDLPERAAIEYKYTRGDWSNVEKATDGSEMDNRTAVVSKSLVLKDKVAGWADVAPAAPERKTEPAAIPGDAFVTFRVTVPDNTPEGEPIYISGDVPDLGAWDGGFIEMTQVEPNVWEAEVEFSVPGPVEYKYTRGDWGTVQKKTDGSEADNNKANAVSGMVTEDRILAWADVPAEAGGEGVTLLSNTAMSSKVMANGRYVSKYVSEKEPDDRYRLNRPSHDIRLDFLATAGPTVSVWARASFYTGEHFHFSFDFDRARAHIHPEEFDLMAFYNEEIVGFDDPFRLVGHGDLRSTLENDDIPFGRGAAGARMEFRRLGMDFAAMVANVHDFDVRNNLDTYDEIGTDWLAGRVTRPLGSLDLGITGRRIRTANWASVYETEPPTPPADMNVQDYSNEFFELNETDDVLALDLTNQGLGGILDVALGAGYQKWSSAWVVGNARERVYLGSNVKVDDEIGSASGYLGLFETALHLRENLKIDFRFQRNFLDSPGEGASYISWVLKHKDEANQHIFPVAVPGHEREIDRAEGGFHWSGSRMGLGISVSRIDDNRRDYLVSSDRHATETRVLPEILLRLGERLETRFRYLYERGTRFGLNSGMGISYAEQEWESGYRFRFASETEKGDTRVFAVNARCRLSRRWFWDLDYQHWNLWRDYGNDRTVEVDGTYGLLFTGVSYEPRDGVQIQLAIGVDPVDDEDDRLSGREIFMRRELGLWQYSDDDEDGIRNYRDRVEWADDTPHFASGPDIGDLMDFLSETKQILIKAKVEF